MSSYLNKVNSFKLLWKDLKARFQVHVSDFSYWTYIFLSVVVFGGLGVWAEALTVWFDWLKVVPIPLGEPVPPLTVSQPLLIALATFFPAISGASLCHSIISTEDNKKYFRSFSLFVLVIILIISVVLFILIRTDHNYMALSLSVVACLISILISWVSNSDIAGISDNDPSDTNAAVGGSTDQDLESHETEIKV